MNRRGFLASLFSLPLALKAKIVEAKVSIFDKPVISSVRKARTAQEIADEVCRRLSLRDMMWQRIAQNKILLAQVDIDVKAYDVSPEGLSRARFYAEANIERKRRWEEHTFRG